MTYLSLALQLYWAIKEINVAAIPPTVALMTVSPAGVCYLVLHGNKTKNKMDCCRCDLLSETELLQYLLRLFPEINIMAVYNLLLLL